MFCESESVRKQITILARIPCRVPHSAHQTDGCSDFDQIHLNVKQQHPLMLSKPRHQEQSDVYCSEQFLLAFALLACQLDVLENHTGGKKKKRKMCIVRPVKFESRCMISWHQLGLTSLCVLSAARWIH